MSLKNKINYQRHPYHLVDPSPWPLLGSISAFGMAFGAVMHLHSYSGGSFLFSFSFLAILYTMFLWWRDIIREATFEGQHTFAVQQGLRQGVLLFIVSEIMFFFAFFWAFFDSSIKPSFAIGGVWPPEGIETINPWGLPILNTAFLLSSGATVTWSHNALRSGNLHKSEDTLTYTLTFAFLFLFFQYAEYCSAPFSINDGIYGSTFFLTTGFHGFHVFIGFCFLCVCSLRMHLDHFTPQHHFGFVAAIWYWHFVDIVWIFLFLTIYWWGS